MYTRDVALGRLSSTAHAKLYKTLTKGEIHRLPMWGRRHWE